MCQIYLDFNIKNKKKLWAITISIESKLTILWALCLYCKCRGSGPLVQMSLGFSLWNKKSKDFIKSKEIPSVRKTASQLAIIIRFSIYISIVKTTFIGMNYSKIPGKRFLKRNSLSQAGRFLLKTWKQLRNIIYWKIV